MVAGAGITAYGDTADRGWRAFKNPYFNVGDLNSNGSKTSILSSTIVPGLSISSINFGITIIAWLPCLAIRLVMVSRVVILPKN